MNTIDQIATELTTNGNRLQPLSNEDIIKVELTFNVSLPKVYKQFLKLMGNGAGAYMQGSSVFFKELFFLREWANDLLLENGMKPLSNSAFVFWMHQGYQVAYFNLNDGDDPPVYFFSEEGEKIFEIKEKSLTKFFISQMSFLH